MAYYHAVNTGKGFITHTDNESAHVAGYPGDVWVTENTTWATRVSATSKTQEEAQALVDAAISGSYYDEGPDSGSAVVVTLP
jgi:hypothetical protein